MKHSFRVLIILFSALVLVLSSCGGGTTQELPTSDKEENSDTAQALQDSIRQKAEVSPPYDGLFVVTDDDKTIELTFERFGDIDEDEYKAMPIITENFPVLVWMSSESDFSEFSLRKGTPIFGRNTIPSNSSPCTIDYNSNNPGIKTGDKILSIDGTEFTDCNQLFNYMDSKQPFSLFSVELQRGTRKEIIDVYAQGVVFRNKIEYSSQYMDNYIAIYPATKLDSGIYCFRKEGWSEYGYCFYIK